MIWLLFMFAFSLRLQLVLTLPLSGHGSLQLKQPLEKPQIYAPDQLLARTSQADSFHPLFELDHQSEKISQAVRYRQAYVLDRVSSRRSWKFWRK